MAYTRPPATTRAGVALTQTPSVTTNALQPVVLDANIATTNSLGVVQVGSGITITPQGVISASGGSSTIGIWSPTISVATAGIITVTTATGSYVKIGQQVICYFDITLLTRTGGANSSALTLNGLPFASIIGTGIVGSLIVTYFENVNTNQTYLTGTVPGSSTSVLLWDQHQQSSSQRLTYADVQAGSSPTRLVGTIQYISAT